MKNLAGNAQCDSDLVRELLTAGINVVPIERSSHEVPFSFVGELSGWRFSRAWYYWVATPIKPNHGLVLSRAKQLYATNKDARVAGHCGAPPPEGWVRWIEVNTGNTIVVDPNGEQFAQFQKFKLSTDGLKFAASVDEKTLIDSTGMAVIPVIDMYHIDTQEALNAFVEAIR